MNAFALRSLAGFLNFTGTEAAGAHVDVSGSPVDEGVDSMNVGELPPFAHVVGVTDLVGDSWTSPADFTATLDLGHSGLLPISGPVSTHNREIVLNNL